MIEIQLVYSETNIRMVNLQLPMVNLQLPRVFFHTQTKKAKPLYWIQAEFCQGWPMGLFLRWSAG